MELIINNTDTLILCGGKGTRLKSIVPVKPKILADINGQPFIEYLLNYLESSGIRRVILCTGYGHHLIEEWIDSSYSGVLEILFSREKESLGTAGAIKNAQCLIKSDDFLVINGDTLIPLDYLDFVRFYYNKEATGLLALTKVNQAREYGCVKIDSGNRIDSFCEKPQTDNTEAGLVNAGVYMFNKVVFDFIPQKFNVSLEKDILPLLLDKFSNNFYGFVTTDSFIDIGTPKNYSKAQNQLKKYFL